MEIKIKNVKGLILPKFFRESDSGMDIIAASEPNIVGERVSVTSDLWKRIDYIEYATNLFIEPPKGHYEPYYAAGRDMMQKVHDKLGYTLVYPRSSISKYNLSLCNQVAIIDNEYRGNIMLRYNYLWQPEDYHYFNGDHSNSFVSFGKPNMEKIYKRGDKCAQLVAAWKEPINWQIVEELSSTERGAGGFGSSDAKKS